MTEIKGKFNKDTFNKINNERKRALLDTALEEFAVKGYSATSVNDIAKKSGISIGSLYSYFASKEDLFLTIVHNAYFIMEDILAKIGNESTDIFDCIKQLITASREFAVKYVELNQLYLDLTTQGLSDLSKRLSNELEKVTPKILSEQIKKGKEAGILNSELDENVAAFCIDNILMIYQFSFSSDYYKERIMIYLGEDKDSNIDNIEKQIFNFIKNAIIRA